MLPDYCFPDHNCDPRTTSIDPERSPGRSAVKALANDPLGKSGASPGIRGRHVYRVLAYIRVRAAVIRRLNRGPLVPRRRCSSMHWPTKPRTKTATSITAPNERNHSSSLA